MPVFEDSKNNIWVASNMGLNLYEPSIDGFKHYTTYDGLSNNTIQSILEDNKGNLWLSTNNGLTVFYNAVNRPENPHFRIYNKNDGLPDNEFTLRSGYKNKNGLFYFGTSKGFTCFYPDSIKDNQVAPQMVINSFEILQDINENKNENLLLDKRYYQSGTLVLDYSKSDFSIKYAALNFLNPENNQYKFRLQGYDDRWYFAGNQRIATYTNIEPGEYTFMVYGTNNDGVWSILPAKLKIIITPPWWDTLLFKILLILLVLLSLIAFYRIRMNLLERQQRILKAKVDEQTKQLIETNTLLEEKSEEVKIQNDELSNHRNNLEKLVEERTFQLEAAKLKAEESDRLKSAFLANMSHEIRTPMNAIVGFASLLEDENLLQDDKRKFIKMINVNSETLMVLIDDIIDISLIESNQLSFSPSIFSATRILIELEEYYKLNNSKDVQIEFSNKNDAGLILELDQVRFWQILNNLLSNAYKYTEKGSITFGYNIFKDDIEFYVKDTGIGIKEANFATIFNHFNKIENKNKLFYRGAGIGLAICKSLVSKMGGKIWVESKIDVGSTFYFTLPSKIIHNSVDKEKFQDKILLDFSNTSILVAEDEPANFELINMYLRNIGAEIIWAKNGKECIDYIKNSGITENLIVLMDIKMPVMDGFDALKEIRKITTKIPVIAITAHALSTDREKIIKQGFDEYLSKPVRKDSLLKVLSGFINSF